MSLRIVSPLWPSRLHSLRQMRLPLHQTSRIGIGAHGVDQIAPIGRFQHCEVCLCTCFNAARIVADQAHARRLWFRRRALRGCQSIQSHRQAQRCADGKQRARSGIEVGAYRDGGSRVNQLAAGRFRDTKMQRYTRQDRSDGWAVAKERVLMRLAGLEMIDAESFELQAQFEAADRMKLLRMQS